MRKQKRALLNFTDFKLQLHSQHNRKHIVYPEPEHLKVKSLNTHVLMQPHADIMEVFEVNTKQLQDAVTNGCDTCEAQVVMPTHWNSKVPMEQLNSITVKVPAGKVISNSIKLCLSKQQVF